MSQGFPITPSSRLSGPYTAGAGQTVFSVTFPFQRAADLSVQVRAIGGLSWTVAPDTDYSITGVMAPGGGTVTFAVARPTGSQVRIVGKAPIASESDAVPAASFDSYTFNTAIDRVVIWVQEVRRDMDALDATGLIEVAQEAADAAVAAAATATGAASATAADAAAASSAASAASGQATAAAASAAAAAASAASIDLSNYLTKTGNLGGLADKAAARTNLGGLYTMSEVDALFDAIVPIGIPVMWDGSTPPTRFLVRDGGLLNIVDFPELFAVYGTQYGGNGTTTFAKPDDRGLFDRGLDLGRGYDTGRTIGSEQADAFKAHTHPTYPTAFSDAASVGGGWSMSSSQTGNTGSTGGTETRPRNRARLPIVRAW
ncbi:tail fiber protein [Xanthobacter sp. V3C-4]